MMNLRPRFTLKTKLAGFAGLLVLVILAGTGVGLYFAQKHYLTQRVQQTQVEMAQLLSQVAREALAAPRADTGQGNLLLSSHLALLSRSRGLSYAMVIDLNGRILAHSDVVRLGQIAQDPAVTQALLARSLVKQTVDAPDGKLLDISLPIYSEGQRMAVARVGFTQASTAKMVDDALQDARRSIVVTAIAALLSGLLGALALAHYLTKPLGLVRDGAKTIGEGVLSHRIPVLSRDELGELAAEFNVMAAKLQELDQLKQDFTSNVTHELRSPLTSLRGYVEFLLRGDAGPLTEEQTEQLIVVKNNAARLAKFIDHLLDVSKIEAMKIELHPEPVHMGRLAKEMAVLFRPQAEEKGIRFSQNVADELPPVWADPDMLSEVLINLLSNAFKFTPPEGRVTLSAKPSDECVEIRVEDTGVGIPADSLEKVFNKFEQVKPTEGLVRKTKGTGLGLTIVKGFVEAHKGRVWLESREGHGTTVHVSLPVAGVEPDEEEA